MSRTHIPEEIKRNVRRKCRFGCILCGSPIFEYDHINNYSSSFDHSVDNLILLCREHHGAKTQGRLPIERIRYLEKNPFNNGRDFTTSAIAAYFSRNNGILELGSAKLEFPFDADGHASALIVDSIEVLGFILEDGHLLINIILFERGRGVVLKILRSEMVVNTGVWDYQLVGRKLRIWSKQRERSVVLTFRENGLELEAGYFEGPASSLTVDRNGLQAGDTQLQGLHLIGGCIRVGYPNGPNRVAIG